jgi:uncharacterized membrane protein YheB (UPF0754 family)
MGAMLLTPALSGKIKVMVKEGIVKMLPDIKEGLLKRIEEEMQIGAIIFPILRSELYRIIIYGGLLGFILGVVWIFLDER